MRTFFYFIRGFKIRGIKLAAFLWLFNLIITSFFFSVIYKFLSLNINNNLQNTREIGIFNIITDSLSNSPLGFKLTLFIGILLIIIYIFFSIFLSAGTLSLLINNDKIFLDNFLSESFYNFFKILKIFIINIVNWLISFFIIIILFIILFKSSLIEKNEALFEVILLLIIILSIIIIFISTLIYDFSRIIKLRKNKNMVSSFTDSIRFIFNNKIDLTILTTTYTIFLLIGYIIYKILNPLNNIINFFIFSLIFYQLFIFYRYYLKIVMFSAEIKLFENKELEKDVIESRTEIIEQFDKE